MGPIERELMTWPFTSEYDLFQWCWRDLSSEARLLIIFACKCGTVYALHSGTLREAISDAIEFAASEGM